MDCHTDTDTLVLFCQPDIYSHPSLNHLQNSYSLLQRQGTSVLPASCCSQLTFVQLVALQLKKSLPSGNMEHNLEHLARHGANTRRHNRLRRQG